MIKRIKSIEDYPVDTTKNTMWRKSSAIKYIVTLSCITFIFGALAGSVIVLGNGYIRTGIERKFLVEFKEYKQRAVECERQRNIMYDVWSGRASVEKLIAKQ